MRAVVMALLSGVTLAASPAAAHDIAAGAISIIHPIARATVAGRPAAAYMAIANDGETADRLIGARSPAFAAAELHQSSEEGGVARMAPVGPVEIAPGDTILLEQGGMHVMLIGATETLRRGDEFPLILIFEQAGEVEVPVRVEDVSAREPDHAGHDQGAHPAKP